VLGVPLAQISSRNEVESKSKKEKVTGNDDMSTRDFLNSLEGTFIYINTCNLKMNDER
jgi:hypothetical protein